MRPKAIVGLCHARGMVPSCVCTILATMGAVLVPDISVGVSTVSSNDARGVGSAEVFGLLLASLLPYLSYPRFGGYELLGSARAARVHLVLTSVSFLTPYLVLGAWHATVSVLHPELEFQSFFGLGGVISLAMASSYLALYLLGGPWSVVVAPATFVLIVVAQQVWPRSFWAHELPTGEHWHTNWWVVTAPIIAVLYLSWRQRGLPASSAR